MSRVRITHFSDILCIWAYVSQIRIDELISEFGDRIELDCRLFPVFGNAADKIASQWRDRGGLAGYRDHVQEVAGQFDHVEIHPGIWQELAPHSSLPAHVYLCAIRLLEAESRIPAGSFFRMAWVIRKAFFVELADIADSAVLDQLLLQHELPVPEITGRIRSGAAYALLGEDMQLARDKVVRSSPTLIFNEDRQRLTGNVGYRIIEANIRELLEKPGEGQSWC